MRSLVTPGNTKGLLVPGPDSILTCTHDGGNFHDELAKPTIPPRLLSVVKGQDLFHHGLDRHVGAQADCVQTLCAGTFDDDTPGDSVCVRRLDNGSMHVDLTPSEAITMHTYDEVELSD